MRGKPKKRVSCAIKILSFQNFYKVLKTCSAGRKGFFDTAVIPVCCRNRDNFCYNFETSCNLTAPKGALYG